MSKKKSKNQKKKFFSNPKNKNKVFKKKETCTQIQEKSLDTELRKRGNYCILSTRDKAVVPQCIHGPCLLFGSKENGEVKRRFFSCAVYRDDTTSCAYKAEIDDKGSIISVEGEAFQKQKVANTQQKVGSSSKVLKSPKDEDWKYKCIPQKLKEIPESSTLVFCRECNDVFETKHKCPSEVVERWQLQKPSEFLKPIENHSGEAQFYFSDESVRVLCSALDQSKANGILCLGAPRIFETLKNKQKKELNLFMLDIDKRYAHFYSSSQFGQYSMLVDYFYDSNTEKKLMKFFEKCYNVVLVCDPPFGVYMEPLMETIEKMRTRYRKARGSDPAEFYSCIIIPMFVGKHVLRIDKGMWMNDYRVTYTNHKMYSKVPKTTVRIFTNLKPSWFDLSKIDGYKFCEICERFVFKSNKHCFMCGSCTSKDGSTYIHCERCMKCVKMSYRHCMKCERCHLIGRCFSKNE